MTVKELLEKLQKFPYEKEVVFYSDYTSEDMILSDISEGTKEIFIDLKAPSLEEDYRQNCLRKSAGLISLFEPKF